MMFDSDEDEFPPIPMSCGGPPSTAVEGDRWGDHRAHRLRELEADVAMLKLALQQGSCPSLQDLSLRGVAQPAESMRRDGLSRSASETSRPSTSHRDCQVEKDARVSASHTPRPLSRSMPVVLSTAVSTSRPCLNASEELQRRDAHAEMELRRLVPHLSPSFHCSFGDCVLLTAAIRNGGCTSRRSGQSGEELSLQERLTMVEAEKKVLQQRLFRQAAECDQLQNHIVEHKEKLEAVKKDARLSAAHIGMKRDEIQRQLLLEETRSQKLRVQNRKLEVELEKLKQRLR